MKRFQLFSLASAMLLASAAGFTSCSSDSEDPLAGGSGVAGQVVKTQFVILFLMQEMRVVEMLEFRHV